MLIAFKILLIATIISGIATWGMKMYMLGNKDTMDAIAYNEKFEGKHLTKSMVIFSALLVFSVLCGILTIILGILYFI